MSRPLRVEFEHAAYHVTPRGNESKVNFRDDQDRLRFLKTLEQSADRFGLVVHAYCLMPNHYHLLIQTPRANLSQGIGWIQATYTMRFKRRHKRSGHLMQGRFKAHLVESDPRSGYDQPLIRQRQCGSAEGRSILSEWPVIRPKDWLARVNSAQSKAEEAAMRTSLVRGRPLGDIDWQWRTASRLGLEKTFRPRGRPRVRPEPGKEALTGKKASK